MNLHLNRRLEVLAREIAEAKKPRISEGATLMFQLAARSPQYKTMGDLKGGSTLLEVAQALAADEAPPVAPPSVQKFKVGDRVRPVESMRWSGTHPSCIVTDVREGEVWAIFSLSHPSYLSPSNVELIEPAPSPASETETEGWVTPCGNTCPVPPETRVRFKLRGRGDDVLSETNAGYLMWGRDREGDTITAYLVVKP